MPKIVDHDLQRVKFAEAAMSLIARDGLEGVTMRAVAAEAGLSYGSLFHYFSSKDELLMHVVQHTASLQTRRVNEFTSQYSGLKALEHLLCDDAIITESCDMLRRVIPEDIALQTQLAPALSGVRLDPVQTSPKVLQALEKARGKGGP